MNDKEIELNKSQAQFALNVLRLINDKEAEKSLIFSPITMSINLAFCYNGAAGDTAKQIAEVIAGGKTQVPKEK